MMKMIIEQIGKGACASLSYALLMGMGMGINTVAGREGKGRPRG